MTFVCLALPVRAWATDLIEIGKDKPWHLRLGIRGYTQFRYNRIGESNPRLKNPQADKAIGEDGGFSLRRARVALYGDVSDYVSIYFQPEFAGLVQESMNVVQVRDWWADLFLDRRKSFRFRVGQQKVPYGFELMQSSQNRAPLDRSDALNSAFVNERDLGIFFFFETETARKRFRRLVDSGLKGSGDYGVTAFGVSNGQPLNTGERNLDKHAFARVTYPFQFGAQIVEVGGGGYSGKFVVKHDETVQAARELWDRRLHTTFVLYPQPLGLQAEYNVGEGPELRRGRIEARPLHGGYIMAMARAQTRYGVLLPYVRLHGYVGGKKFETNAPRHEVRELNVGLEWQPSKWLELTAELMLSRRRVDDDAQAGRLLRVQAQVSY